jgi:hypothetical protein
MRRRIVLLASWTIGLVALAWPAASARYLGSDVIGNVSPESQVGGGLVDKYPLSAYALDYHVDVGLTDPGGVAPMIAHWAAAQLWSMTSFLVKVVIDLFTWAFSLDLLGGDPNTGADGALGPVSDAIASVYENVIGEAWMVVAILVAGIWGIWKALVQRRYTETAGALGISVLFVLVALFFVYQPERTVGEASRWTNTMSLAFLSGANRGSLDDPQQAKRHVADHLFESLVYRPWVVLQFGGLRHCVDTGQVDEHGYPRPVGPHDPARDVCRDHLEPGRDGHGGYAPRFLRQPAGSDERDAEYDVLRKGELPEDDRQFAGYRVDKADSPAVDIQQAGGAFQRLTVAVVLFLGTLGAVALLGFLSLAVILAQIVALVLLGFAPVALVIGIFPGAGHAFFRGWLAKLATAVFIKALYSLVIAIVVAVSAALASATDSLGFLLAFGLQAVFFWAIFLYRKQISARLVAATTGSGAGASLPRMSVVQRGAEVATRPFSALMAGAALRRGTRGGRQESALAGAVVGGPGGSDPFGGAPNGNGRAPLDGASGSNGHAAGGAAAAVAGAGTAAATLAGARGHGTGGAAAALAGARGNGTAGGARGSGTGGAAATLGDADDGAPLAGAHGNGAGAAQRGNGHAPPAGDASPHLAPGDPLRVGAHPPAPALVASGAERAHGEAPPPARTTRPAGELSPRAAHEDVMRRARELRRPPEDAP